MHIHLPVNHDILFNLRDLLIVMYVILIILGTIVCTIELKLYFVWDIPGVDLPIDEWYVSVFK